VVVVVTDGVAAYSVFGRVPPPEDPEALRQYLELLGDVLLDADDVAGVKDLNDRVSARGLLAWVGRGAREGGGDPRVCPRVLVVSLTDPTVLVD
jgi:hypothetical protein